MVNSILYNCFFLINNGNFAKFSIPNTVEKLNILKNQTLDSSVLNGMLQKPMLNQWFTCILSRKKKIINEGRLFSPPRAVQVFHTREDNFASNFTLVGTIYIALEKKYSRLMTHLRFVCTISEE